MGNQRHKHLFQPIKIGNVLFKNRLCASPQGYPGLTGNGYLTEEAAHFYEKKALGGFASVTVGNFMIDGKDGRSHPFMMRGDDLLGKTNLTRVSTGITRHGAIASAEFVHAGKNTNIALNPDNKGYVLGPSDCIRPDGVEVRAMTEEQIEAVIGKYVLASLFARRCGFGMITLHGGHGWQFSQFISPRDNKRTDRWGGSIENRMRFPLAVIEAIRKAIGNTMPIEYRMSVAEFLPDGYDEEIGLKIAQMLDGKVDLINASVGHHEVDSSSMITMPSMFLPDGCNVRYAEMVKKVVNTPVSAVGALTDPQMMEEIIASGKADMIAIGRQVLADPDLPIKTRLGKADEISPCIRCFNCFSSSTVGGICYCAVNPEIGREESSMHQSPARYKKTVLVVGGGVGGMQAAITAEQRGHRVILCEKADRLGGVLLCEEKIPFKANLKRYLKSQEAKIDHSSIELHLKTEITPETAKSFKPDVIISAIGARPIIPQIKRINGENVFGAEDVYYHPEIVGEKAVIIGGGLVGLELGLYLAQNSHDVTVVEMADRTIATPPKITGVSNRISGVMDVPAGYPLVHGVALKEELKKYPNMQICTSTNVLEVTGEGLSVEDEKGVRTIKCDTIIYSVGQKPLTDIAIQFNDCAAEVHLLGDCLVPKNIYVATSAAYQIATDIGRF